MLSTIMSTLGTKVAAAATAAALLAGGAAGASAAFGGPNVAGSVHEVLGQSQHSGDSGSDNEVTDAQGGENSGHGHETCSEATQHALERLNELKADGKPVDNAIQAVENCGNGSDGADAEAETEDQDNSANPNAEEKSNNADDGINNSGDHAENGKSHANPRAFDGSGGAGVETEGEAD